MNHSEVRVKKRTRERIVEQESGGCTRQYDLDLLDHGNPIEKAARFVM
jgi:hypothetical protein